ncbi:diamine acetyltransferase 1-like [Diadema antillarum]|uniref:diamine acetyltransferase 1-like n=1 Tax=Diadema antillarum TaxID=105358 RepID=UPI003A866F17
MAPYVVRRGSVEDIDDLLRLITALADYIKESPLTITAEDLVRDAFTGEDASLKFYVGEYLPLSATKEAGGHGSVVGFAAVHDFYDIVKGRVWFVCGIYVDEKHRGQNLGTLLMKAIAKDAVEAGCQAVDGHVDGWNVGAKRFYARMGVVNLTET